MIVGDSVVVSGLPGVYMVACVDRGCGTVDLVAVTSNAEDVDDVESALCSKVDPAVIEAEPAVTTNVSNDNLRTSCGSTQEQADLAVESTMLRSILAGECRHGVSNTTPTGKLSQCQLEFVDIPYMIGCDCDAAFESSVVVVDGIKIGGVREYDEPGDEMYESTEVLPDGEALQHIHLNLRNVLSATGGRVWDSSIILAAWLAQGGHKRLPLPIASEECRGGRILELGAGLGVLGLAVAQMLKGSGARVVMSDYDVEVLERLQSNVMINCATFCESETPLVTMIDFRDFAGPNALSTTDLAERYGSHLGNYDCIIAADIVYQHSHAILGNVVRKLLKGDSDHPNLKPCALFMLPDSRPALQTFVDHARSEDGGLMHVTCSRIDQACSLMQRLRKSRTGLGSAQSFSLYKLVPPPSHSY